MSAHPKQSARRAGFTLIELMIALTVGGIAIGTMYAMSTTSARTFQVQHQVANMQSSLRFAYTQLKRDFLRAGYHVSPNARRPNIDMCNMAPPLSSGSLAGISSFRDNLDQTVIDPSTADLNTAARGFSHDEITLIGNYASAHEYPGLIVNAADSVSLNTTPGQAWHSVQADFGWDPDDGLATTDMNAQEIARAFPNGSLIRIQTRTGRRHFATLNAAPTIGIGVITFTFSPSLSSLCQSEAAFGWIAPLRIIRYGVELSQAGSLDSDRVTGNRFAQLIRSQLQASDMTAIAPVRPILDYAATFNVSFVMNANNLPGQADNYVIGRTVAESAPGTEATAVNNSPERVRSVVVELGVRAPDVDPGMVWPCGNVRQACMALNPETDAGSPAARVRVLRSEIFLPNIAFEGF